VLALLEAGMLAALSSRLRGMRAALALASAVLLLAAEPLMSAVAHNRIAGRADTRVLATRWMADNLPPASRLVVIGTRFWPWGRPMIPPAISNVRVKHEGGVLSEAALTKAGIDYVLTHDHPLWSSTVDPAVIEALDRCGHRPWIPR
jgi:hypothetical protein